MILQHWKGKQLPEAISQQKAVIVLHVNKKINSICMCHKLNKASSIRIDLVGIIAQKAKDNKKSQTSV